MIHVVDEGVSLASESVPFQSLEERNQFLQLVQEDLNKAEALLQSCSLRDVSGEHIGVEQEMQLVGRNAEPALAGPAVGAQLHAPCFQSEFSQFTFEIALEPARFAGNALSDIHDTLLERLRDVSRAGQAIDVRPSLLAILPSLRAEHISPSSITLEGKYKRLNAARQIRRGSGYEYRIEGMDRLAIRDDEILLAGAFTSLQLHWQVAASTGAGEYNWAQAIAAPCLAAAAASPLLLGHRLWHETRVPLFEQTSDLDCRHAPSAVHKRSRAGMGQGWISSILDVWHEDVAAHEPLLGLTALPSHSGDPLALTCLQFFNSTVYRWNRLCFGTDGKTGPALRIEARMLPSGPTVPDELANAAFWWGLMVHGAKLGSTVPFELSFDRVRENFRRAARDGLECQLHWTDGRLHSACELVSNWLIPMALEGLQSRGISDAEFWLDPLIRRVAKGQSPSRWMLDAFDALRERSSRGEASLDLTRMMMELADQGRPICDWPDPRPNVTFAAPKPIHGLRDGMSSEWIPGL